MIFNYSVFSVFKYLMVIMYSIENLLLSIFFLGRNWSEVVYVFNGNEFIININ